MNIFIDTISSHGTLVLFNEERTIISRLNIEIKGNESSRLIPYLEGFLKENSLHFSDIENIVLIHGPGSFTGVRTTVLVVNTIAYLMKDIALTPISYFELFNRYPIVKSSSKRDCFVMKSKGGTIEIIQNEKLGEYFQENKIGKIYGEANADLFPDVKILDNIDYESIIQKIKFKDVKRIEPLYIKKPNIS